MSEQHEPDPELVVERATEALREGLHRIALDRLDAIIAGEVDDALGDRIRTLEFHLEVEQRLRDREVERRTGETRRLIAEQSAELDRLVEQLGEARAALVVARRERAALWDALAERNVDPAEILR